MARIHDRIRQILENSPALTQRGLAEKMGLNPAAVNRMLHGRRNIMAEELPIIEQYLGQRLNIDAEAAAGAEEFRQMRGAAPMRGFSDAAQSSFTDAGAFVPVQAYDFGVRKVVDWVQRHPAQAGIPEAFAVYVPGDDMAPRYFRGELVYLHPGRPAAVNGDCLIEIEGQGWIVRRLLALEQEGLRVQRFSPPLEENLSKSIVKSVYAIVGRG